MKQRYASLNGVSCDMISNALYRLPPLPLAFLPPYIQALPTSEAGLDDKKVTFRVQGRILAH